MNQTSKISITFPRTRICTAASGTFKPTGCYRKPNVRTGWKATTHGWLDFSQVVSPHSIYVGYQGLKRLTITDDIATT